MQIPVLNGIYTDTNGDFRSSYPKNYMPVPKEQGISKGYLRPADGIAQFATGLPGIDRGGINWNNACYRIAGTKLISVDAIGNVSTLGTVGGSGQVTFDYSFDRLAVCSSGNFYYWNGTALTQVTDADLGTVIDFIWVDGYFMTTDGTNLVVTELNDPTSVNPLKYGSAEVDPDPIKALIKIRNEPYAVGRYSIEVYRNVGGDLFPFQRIDGAQIMRGAIGTYACAEFILNASAGIAFLGSAKKEPPAIWFGLNGSTVPLSTREIDTILQEYTEGELATSVLETRIDKKQALLYVHLPDQTLVYDANASQVLGEPVWFHLHSALVGTETYQARNLVWCYDKWISGDPTQARLGYFVSNVSSHYNTAIGWEFNTVVIYNESHGAIFHELELVGLTGNVAVNKDPSIWTCYSNDGLSWSQERARKAGRIGQTGMRLNWLQQGFMNNRRIQKFRGNSDAHIAIARLEARLEPLSN